MKQMMSALPVACRRCGELFDLAYDLEDISQERLMQELLRMRRNPQTSLCWECRASIKKM